MARIWCCCGCGVGSSDLTPSLGTSICHECGPKNTKKKKTCEAGLVESRSLIMTYFKDQSINKTIEPDGFRNLLVSFSSLLHVSWSIEVGGGHWETI